MLYAAVTEGTKPLKSVVVFTQRVAHPMFLSSLAKITRSLLVTLHRDIGILLVGRLLLLLSGLLLSILLVRRFGLDTMGIYTAASPMSLVLSMLGSLGLPYALARHNVETGQKTAVSVLAWLTSLPIAVMLSIIYAFIIAHNDSEFYVIFIFSITGFVFGLNEIATMLLVMTNRHKYCLCLPGISILGIVVASCGSTVEEFTSIFAMSRLIGVIAQFIPLPFMFPQLRVMRAMVWDGVSMLRADIINIVSDQSLNVLMTRLLTRDQLGIFGICRQLMAAGMIPIWSFSQSHYPDIVRTRFSSRRNLERQALLLSMVVAGGVCVISYIMGKFIYQEGRIFTLMTIFSISIPSLFLCNLYSPALRAIGEVRWAVYIVLVSMPVSLGAQAVATNRFGLIGTAWCFVIVNTTIMVAFRRLLLEINPASMAT